MKTTACSTDWLDQAAGGDPVRLAQLDAMDPKLAAARARQARTANIEQLVARALDNAELRAHLAAVHPSRRTSLVVAHLNRHGGRYGIAKAPDRETVRVLLVKHGVIPAASV